MGGALEQGGAGKGVARPPTGLPASVPHKGLPPIFLFQVKTSSLSEMTHRAAGSPQIAVLSPYLCINARRIRDKL